MTFSQVYQTKRHQKPLLRLSILGALFSTPFALDVLLGLTFAGSALSVASSALWMISIVIGVVSICGAFRYRIHRVRILAISSMPAYVILLDLLPFTPLLHR